MAYGTALAALADPTRRAVFERLSGGPLSVGEIAADLPVSRPAVSQHLKVLKEAGLVRDEADGVRRVYEVDPRGLAELRSWLDRFWDDALAAFKAEVERSPQPRRRKKTR
ncbi:MAG TPA: metalloregulator ArsR/SmtB family transcription factor [Burkholderiaceae bacterium]|nr:metalloregulator ArsR/SmtB family transcription factor [Burkholderiaceae bacterium]